MTVLCRCGHVAAAHLEFNPDLIDPLTACQPRRGRKICRCLAWEPRPEPSTCPLGNARHSRAAADCDCVAGQMAIEDVLSWA